MRLGGVCACVVREWCVHAWIHTCVHLCLRACMKTCMCVRILSCVCTCIRSFVAQIQHGSALFVAFFPMAQHSPLIVSKRSQWFGSPNYDIYDVVFPYQMLNETALLSASILFSALYLAFLLVSLLLLSLLSFALMLLLLLHCLFRFSCRCCVFCFQRSIAIP